MKKTKKGKQSHSTSKSKAALQEKDVSKTIADDTYEFCRKNLNCSEEVAQGFASRAEQAWQDDKSFSDMVHSARKLSAEDRKRNRPKVREEYPGQIIHEVLNIRHS